MQKNIWFLVLFVISVDVGLIGMDTNSDSTNGMGGVIIKTVFKYTTPDYQMRVIELLKEISADIIANNKQFDLRELERLIAQQAKLSMFQQPSQYHSKADSKSGEMSPCYENHDY